MPGVWVFPGGALDPADGEGELRVTGPLLFGELREEAGIELGADHELVLFSRWITPELISRRFDAWFFLALAPAHSPPRPDGVETTDAGWFEPPPRWMRTVAGGLALAFPTASQLKSLLGYTSSEEAIAAHRGRAVGRCCQR